MEDDMRLRWEYLAEGETYLSPTKLKMVMTTPLERKTINEESTIIRTETTSGKRLLSLI